MIEDARVKAVTLTGSERAGSEVASAAARADQEKCPRTRRQRSLYRHAERGFGNGGRTGVKARTINTGQSCIAAKRFIVAEKSTTNISSRFVEQDALAENRRSARSETEIGPLATEQILSGVDDTGADIGAAGAKLLTGGRRIKRAGFFYEPTVLADIPLDAPAYSEEVFGPWPHSFACETRRSHAMANNSRFRTRRERVD